MNEECGFLVLTIEIHKTARSDKTRICTVLLRGVIKMSALLVSMALKTNIEKEAIRIAVDSFSPSAVMGRPSRSPKGNVIINANTPQNGRNISAKRSATHSRTISPNSGVAPISTELPEKNMNKNKSNAGFGLLFILLLTAK
jgi:hypothetical protein